MSVQQPRWSAQGVYLALESSGPVASVAVARGRDVLARAFLPRASEQASRMVPAVAQVLGAAGVPRGKLTGVVVGAGPGSFTGVRIAAATAKGLAHALGVPLWSFPSLAAGALSDLSLPPGEGLPGWWSEPSPTELPARRWVLFDARGDRLYAACYEVGASAVEERIQAHATTVAEVLERSAQDDAALAGDGAFRHEASFRAAGRRVLGPPAGVPTADALLRLLSLDPDRAPVNDVAGWEPEYLKASSAERERLAVSP